MGPLRPFVGGVKGSSLRRVLLQGAALVSLLALLLPPPVALARPRGAPVPGVTLVVPGQVSLGDGFDLTVSFDNTSAGETGYGPYFDVYLPLSGADGLTSGGPNDGLTFAGATFYTLGLPATTLTCSPGATFTHPLTGLIVTCPAAMAGSIAAPFIWQVNVLQLPFGSFTPTQTPADVAVRVNMSNRADVDKPLPIRVQPGYIYGDTPTGTNGPIVGGVQTTSVTPHVLTVQKAYNGPEDETATGPNYPRRYTVTANIADLQQINSFTLRDNLPGNMQFVQMILPTIPGGATCTTPSTITPGGTISCAFGTVTGGAGAGDVSFTFEYFIPLRDSGSLRVIDPTSGDDVLSCNHALGGGNWVPLDTRDPAAPVSQPPGASSGCTDTEHTLTDKSIAIQKSVANLTDASNSPGDVLEYTLNVQVSDFFAFQNVVVTDTISDGQHFQGGPTGFTPTLQVSGNPAAYDLGVAGFGAANFSVDCDYSGPVGPECTIDSSGGSNTGDTTMTFSVSNEMVRRGLSTGKLVGGCIPFDGVAGGTGGSDPLCSGLGSYNDGATTLVLKYRAVIQEVFTDDFPSGDAPVDQGDQLGNAVSVNGDLLSEANTANPTGQSEADTSGAGVTLPYGVLTKSIYAVGGVVCSPQPCSNVVVSPGDTITYRVTYTLPQSNFEDLMLTDFLPLPLLRVDDPDGDTVAGPSWTFDDVIDASAPATGHIKFGPGDTFRPVGGNTIGCPLVPNGPLLGPGDGTPCVETNASSGNNSLFFKYGDFDDPLNRSTAIDLLFTLTVRNDPFADLLFHTNQAHADEGSTNAGSTTANDIVQIKISEPLARIRKGVIASNNAPPGVFAPAPPVPAGVSISAPGGACPRFSGGPIQSGNLGATFNSNLSGVDAGDLVTFGVVVENTGSRSAFDVRVRDTLPAGFSLPVGGLNLCVTDGTGSPIAYSALGAGFFDPAGGIELTDPGPTPSPDGALDPGRNLDGSTITTGRNLAVITYDLQLDGSVAPNQVITNTATLFNYAGVEGGINHVPGGVTDPATVTTALPAVAKTITGTNQAHTLGNNVAIGEQVTYQLVISIPEGVSNNVTVVDTLDSGLAFISLDSLTASADLSTSIAGGFPQVLTNAQAALAAPGNVATYSFGTLSNDNRVNADPETITITYAAVVLNSAGNNRGVGRNNTAVISWTGGSASGAAPNVVIVEPTLQAAKLAVPPSGDAGDVIDFTLTFSHSAASDADAFNVALTDPLPAGMTYVGASLNCTSGAQDPDSSSFFAGVITASWTSFLDNGTTGICTFQVTLNDDVEPGQVITNTANLAWTGLPGDIRTPQSTLNPLSTERTGDPADPGGAENDYRASGPATVTILQVPIKSLVATSESHTADPRVAIGEIARYHLAFQLAEGIATNLRLQDELPAGMQFLNDGTARVAFVSNGAGITSTTINPGLPDCSGLVTSGNSAAVTPTCPLPDEAVSTSDTLNDDTYASGTDVYLKLGTLDNRDRDVDAEYAVIEFNALVENIGGNTAGHALGNDFIPRVGTTAFPASNSLVVTVAVPNVTLTKVVTTAPSDAGDALVYTLTATNASGANVAAAFDLSIVDTIDARLAIQSVSGSTTGGACGATPSTFSGGFVGQQVTATATCLNPGATMTVVITARVVSDIQAGSTIPNIANLVYTTLPGLTGTSPNPTGSTTPGGSGSPTGERGLVGQANASHTLAVPSVSKQAPIPAQQTIGGEADYDLVVTLPEGATTNLRVRDVLPAGLGYVSHNVITTAAGSGGLLAADYNGALTITPACPACVVGASGVTLEFQFGDVQTNGSGPANGTAANQFLVRVRARVLNVAGNQNGSTLHNSANLGYVNPQTGDTTIADGSRTLTVTEPELQLTKAANDDTPALGQTVTYTLTVSHAPASTADAQDIIVTDVIPAGLTYVAGSATAPAGWTADASSAPTLVFSGSLTQAAGSASFTYQATLGVPPAVIVGQTLTNTAGATWTSLPGPSPVERTGTGVGPNDYATSASETVTASEIDLTLTKDDGGITAAPGQTYAYTLAIRNIGNVDATGVTVTDTVPLYTAFEPVGSSPGWSCLPDNNAGSICTNNVGNLAAGDTIDLTFRVTVVSALPVLVTETSNTARVDGLNEPVLLQGNNNDTETTPLGAAPDLTITKDDGLDIVSPGSLLVYAVNYANAGNQDASGVVVTETVPDETTFDAAASLPTVWSCPDGSTGGTICTFTVGGLTAGSAGNLSFAVRVDDPVTPGTTQIVNTIRINDDGLNGPEPTPGNNTDTDTDNLVTLPSADLTKLLVDDNQAHTLLPAAAIGEILTYELVLTIPQGTMTSATLTDVLDLGLAFESCADPVASAGLSTNLPGGFPAVCDLPANPTVAAEPPGNPADQGRRVTFNLGALTNPGPATATLMLRYTAVAIDNPENVRGVGLNNRVTWTWVGGQLIESASDVILVEPTLTLEKDADPRSGPPGGVVTFTLTINNPAPPSDSPAFDLELTDTVPAGMAYVAGTLTASGGGTIDDSAAPLLQVTWPALGLNDTVTATFQATIGNLPAGTQIRNDAYLDWSTLPGDVTAPQSAFNTLSTERVYDPPINANVVVAIPSLPETGFAPDRVTELHGQSQLADLGDLTLEIPALEVSILIVGVPADENGWDLTWLAGQAGYLEGTAYPTHKGNSALTAHVTLPNGRPGPFALLGDLHWGDHVVVHVYGMQYIYEVRTVARVYAGNLSSLGHKDQAWLTLITCRTYDETGGQYLHREVVQAVLIEVARE